MGSCVLDLGQDRQTARDQRDHRDCQLTPLILLNYTHPYLIFSYPLLINPRI